jgi:hypothetical protein
MRKVELEEIAVQHSERKKQKAPLYASCRNRSVSGSAGALLRERKRETRPGDKKKQGEYRIHESEAVPFDVPHLLAQKTILAEPQRDAYLGEKERKPHDEKHVEASESIKGEKPLSAVSVFVRHNTFRS